MRNFLTKTLLGGFIIFLALIHQTSFAQGFDIYSADDIFVDISPEIPGPNEKVDLFLKSYSFNLNNYFITWFENGEKKTSGYGERRLSFTTKNSSETTFITAVVEVDSKVYRKELRFTPSSVDLIWEATDAYAPPFYKGKKLPMTQSTVTVTAIPETQVIAPADAKNLVYYWDRNYKRNIEASGFGKQSFTFDIDGTKREEIISVTSNDRRENSFAKNQLNLPTQENNIRVLLYEVDQYDRILTNRALNSFPSIDKTELKMSFHPLHMSSVAKNFTDLFVNWKINDLVTPPQNFAYQNEIRISSGGVPGSVKIDVVLENIKKLLQKRTETVTLHFNR